MSDPSTDPTVSPPAADAHDDTATAVDRRLDPGVTADSPAVEASVPIPPPDIPGYQVEAELGRGGMGVVFKARHLRLNRPVAIKMILGGRYADPAAHFRFLAEAEAIAQLQHPGVVQVYEVGQHDGLPFFALEYVGGGTLAQRLARDGRFAPRAAAALVATVADAVAAAHERGIVHRDLKPANILLSGVRDQESGVTKAPVLTPDSCPLTPKVTDFGLAKVGRSDVTGSRAVMGTPSYMSPEQAAGKTREVGTPADVWALGAVLYECLTGRPPFRGDTVMDTVQQVMTREPDRPRAVVRDVPRDLETICLKCLEKDPARRYPTAAALAADLQAFLAGRPIAARPVGSLERGWKWAKRRPGPAAVLAGSVLAAIGFVAVVAGFNVRLHEERNQAVRDRDAARTAREQADQAREQALANFRLARKAVDVYTSKIAEDPRLQGFGLDEVRKEWLLAGSEFYREFARQYGDDPAIETERARAFAKLAGITSSVGAPAEAANLFAQARAIQERLATEYPDQPEHRFDLSNTLFVEADAVRKAGKVAESRPLYDRAITLLAELAREHPAEGKYAVAHAAGWNNLGLAFKDDGQRGPAEEAFRKAIRVMAAAPPTAVGPAGEDPALFQALAYANLGGLYVDVKRYREAGEVLQTALDIQSKSTNSHEARAALALTRFARGGLALKTDRLKDAERELAAAVDLFDPLTARFPANLDYQNAASASRMFLGKLYLDADRPADAERVVRKGVDALEALTRLDPGSRQFRTNLFSGYQVLAMIYFSSQRAAELEAVARPALALAAALAREDGGRPEFPEKECELLRALAKMYEATDRRPESEKVRRRELALRETLARDHPSAGRTVDLAGTRSNLGIFLASARPDEALDLYNRAEADLRAVLARDPRSDKAGEFLRNALFSRAGLHQRRKRFNEAAADRRQVIELTQAVVAADPSPANRAELADGFVRLARTHKTASRKADAADAYRRALAHYEDLIRSRPDDPDHADSLAGVANELGLLLVDLGWADEAEAAYHRGIDIGDRLAARHPKRVESRITQAGIYCNLGHLIRSQGKSADALPWYTKAVGILRAVLDDGSGEPELRDRARRYLKNTYDGRATALATLGRPAEAAVDAAELVAFWERQAAGKSDESDPQSELAANLAWLGDQHHAARQWAPAADAFGRAATTLAQVVARDPKAFVPRARLAAVLEKHGKVYGAQGDFTQSVPHFEKAVALREELAREFPVRTDNATALQQLSVLLARAYLVTKAPDKAEATLVRVADVRQDLARARPDEPIRQRELADALETLGRSYALRDQHARAEPVLREAAAAWERYARLAPPADVAEKCETMAECLASLGEVQQRLGRPADAAAAYTRAVDLYDSMARNGEKPAAAVNRGGCLTNLGHALQPADPAKSLDPYNRAIVVLRKITADDPANAMARTYLRNAVYGRATALRRLKRDKEALADYDWLIELEPADRKAEAVTARTSVMARLGEHERAAAEADKLAAGADGVRLYNLACTLSLCSTAEGVDRARADAYAGRAVALLRRAAATGYFKAVGRVDHLKADVDLDSLRRRDDFRAFVADLIATPAAPPTESGPMPRVVGR